MSSSEYWALREALDHEIEVSEALMEKLINSKKRQMKPLNRQDIDP